MRRSTFDMTQYRADTQTGQLLTFAQCRGGYFSTQEPYALRVVGTGTLPAGTTLRATGKNLCTQTAPITFAGYYHGATPLFTALPLGATCTLSYTYTTTGGTQEGATGKMILYATDGARVLSSGSSFTVTAGVKALTPGIGYMYGNNGASSTTFSNIQIELGNTATPYAPCHVSELLTPTALHAGDVWLPALGQVLRAGSITPESYPPQALLAQSGTLHVYTTAAAPTLTLQATMLVRR